MLKRIIPILFVIFGLIAAMPIHAAEFPTKEVQIIIPWAAGGATDLIFRALAATTGKYLGKAVVVVNRPGGGGAVGYTEGAQAKPDGYTMGFTNMPATLTTYLDPTRKAVYGRGDFQPLANQVSDPCTIDVRGDSPFKSLKDLVDAAKAAPDKVKVATAGLLTPTHISLLVLQKAANVRFAIVHFNGGAPGVAAMLGGHVDALSSTVGDHPAQVRAGGIRVLGIFDKERTKFFPSVPTSGEQGYEAVVLSTRGVSVPAGTPKEIVEILSTAIKKTMESDELTKKMDEVSLRLQYMDPQQYAAHWAEFEAQTKELMQQLAP